MSVKNIKFVREGNELVARINLDEEHGPTNGGKGIVVAKTGGYQKLGGDFENFKLTMHCYKLPLKEPKEVKEPVTLL